MADASFLSIQVWLLDDEGKKFDVGVGYLLGSPKEMPWTNEILSKYEITDAVHNAGLSVDRPIKVQKHKFLLQLEQ
jgi:hypothetical protein